MATPYSVRMISESPSGLDLLLLSYGERTEILLFVSNICAKIWLESQNPLDVELLTDPEIKKASTLELTIFQSFRQTTEIGSKWGIKHKNLPESRSWWGNKPILTP